MSNSALLNFFWKADEKSYLVIINLSTYRKYNS